MIFPLYKLGAFGDVGLVIMALLVGFGFGFLLEKAGFGNSKKIAAVFYAEDWRVYKMMYSIVITAMVLTYGAYYFGFLDLSLVQLASFKFLPVMIGGLIFGGGMVIGGYCPGTATVSLATRKIDGIIFLFGFMLGVLIYAEVYSYFENFATSTNYGQLTLGDVINIPSGVLVFIAVVIGVVSFPLLDKVEGKMYKKKADEE